MATSNFDITSANAEAFLTVEDVFPSGVQLQMFGADQSWSADSVDIAETRMGVDGRMVAGYTPAIYPVTITLEPPSPSRASLATLWEAMVTNRAVYKCTLVITLPSIGEVYTFSNGVLKSGNPTPAGGKTLQPTTWAFEFETMEKSQI